MPTNSDNAQRIRSAYGRLLGQPYDPMGGNWVKLSDLWAALPDLSKAEFDAAVHTLKVEDGRAVWIVPESRQGLLTDADREAAVVIGNQPNHLIDINLEGH